MSEGQGKGPAAASGALQTVLPGGPVDLRRGSARPHHLASEQASAPPGGAGVGGGQGRAGGTAECGGQVSPGHSEAVPAVTAATREENGGEATETPHQPPHPSSTLGLRGRPEQRQEGGFLSACPPLSAQPPCLWRRPLKISVGFKCHQCHCVSEGWDLKLGNWHIENI